MKHDKPPIESKKFILATIAIALSFIVWAASYVGVLINSGAAPHVVSLATMIVGLLGAAAAAGITGQSFVDVKLAGQVTQNNTDTTVQETKDVNIKVVAPKHCDDGTVS